MSKFLPMKICEHLNLGDSGISTENIGFETVSLNSDGSICVLEKNGKSELSVINIRDPKNPIHPPLSAVNSATIDPTSKLLAFKHRTTHEDFDSAKRVSIFNLQSNSFIKDYVFLSKIVFFKWISPEAIAICTKKKVFNWKITEDNSIPVEVFDLHSSLNGYTVVNYLSDFQQKWIVLVALKKDVLTSCTLGAMQLYSAEGKFSQRIEGHAASFAQLTLKGNTNPTTILCYAVKNSHHGKLHLDEVGPLGHNQPFTKTLDLSFKLGIQNDFPLAIQVCSKYDFVFVITTKGFINLFDIETTLLICIREISEYSIFVTAPHEAGCSLIAVNKRGQVFSVQVDENVFTYISAEIKNPNLIKRVAIQNNIPIDEESLHALPGQSGNVIDVIVSMVNRRFMKLEAEVNELKAEVNELKAQNKTMDMKLTELLLKNSLIKLGEASNRMSSVCEREKVRQLAKKSSSSIENTSGNAASTKKTTSFDFSLPPRVNVVCQRFIQF